VTNRAGLRLTFAVLALALASYGVLQSLVIPVLPTLQRDLHTSARGVSSVLTSYLVSASVFTPIVGRVGDMIGKRRTFVCAISALAVGSLLAALATSLPLMLVGRGVQGIGGGVMPLAFGILRDELPARRVAGAVGVAAATATAAGGIGVVVGGPIVHALGFHWLFWTPMILTAAAAVLAHFVIPDSPVMAGGRINPSAVLALCVGLVALLIGVSQGPSWGWTSLSVLGLFALFVLSTVAWLRIESTSAQPLIDVRMMRLRAVWTANLVALLFGFGLYAASAYIPAMVQAPRSTGYGFGSSISGSGWFILCLTAFMFLASLWSGPLVRAIGARLLLIIGSGIDASGFLLLALERGRPWEVVIEMSWLGIGAGLLLSSASALVVAAVPPAETGMASGMNANFRTIGGSIGVAVTASIPSAAASDHGYPAASGFTRAFVVLAVASAVSAIPSALMARRRGALQLEVDNIVPATLDAAAG